MPTRPLGFADFDFADFDFADFDYAHENTNIMTKPLYRDAFSFMPLENAKNGLLVKFYPYTALLL